MDKRLGRAAPDKRRRLLDGEPRAGFVVDQHDADQNGVLPAGRGNLLRRQASLFIGNQPVDLRAFLFQRVESGGDGGVLDGGCDRVAAPPLARGPAAQNCQVVCFGAAGGEDQRVRRATQQLGDRPPGRRQFLLRCKADGVQGGRVAVAAGHHFIRLVGRLFADGGGGAVVQIGLLHEFNHPVCKGRSRRVPPDERASRFPTRSPHPVLTSYYITKRSGIQPLVFREFASDTPNARFFAGGKTKITRLSFLQPGGFKSVISL